MVLSAAAAADAAAVAHVRIGANRCIIRLRVARACARGGRLFGFVRELMMCAVC